MLERKAEEEKCFKYCNVIAVPPYLYGNRVGAK
jgi:hypothetical protein